MKTLVLAVVVATLVGAAAEPAAAAARQDQDCVVFVDSGIRKCFDNYRSAIEFATGGAISDAPLSAQVASDDPAFRVKVNDLSARGKLTSNPNTALSVDAQQSGEVIGAVLFTGSHYTGSSETFMTPYPCPENGKIDFGWKLGSSLDRHARSVQSWGNCWVWLYDSPNQDWQGQRQGPYKEDAPDLGDWNDRATMLGLS